MQFKKLLLINICIFCILSFVSQVYAKPSKIIVIDPGHGTKNSRGGASGEAKINLKIAQKVKQKLINLNVNAILTHEFIGQDLGAKNAESDNKIRASIANKNNAVLFLRLHCDSASGSSCIYFPRKHFNSSIASESNVAAHYLFKELSKINLPKPFGIKGDESTLIGGQNGGLLTGSKYSKVPVELFEMVPLSKAGISWINNEKNQNLLVNSMVLGIVKYIEN